MNEVEVVVERLPEGTRMILISDLLFAYLIAKMRENDPTLTVDYGPPITEEITFYAPLVSGHGKGPS